MKHDWLEFPEFELPEWPDLDDWPGMEQEHETEAATLAEWKRETEAAKRALLAASDASLMDAFGSKPHT